MAGGYDSALRIRSDADFHLRLSLEGQWRHLRGKPVIKRHDVAGETRLTRDIDTIEHKLVMGRILADFLLQHASRRTPQLLVWGKPLFEFWMAQGQSLAGEGRAKLAEQCTRVGNSLLPLLSH
jgi:hypothetical protein